MTEEELRAIRARAWWNGCIVGAAAILVIFIVGPML